jgi:hypothetical protein
VPCAQNVGHVSRDRRRQAARDQALILVAVCRQSEAEAVHVDAAASSTTDEGQLTADRCAHTDDSAQNGALHPHFPALSFIVLLAPEAQEACEPPDLFSDERIRPARSESSIRHGAARCDGRSGIGARGAVRRLSPGKTREPMADRDLCGRTLGDFVLHEQTGEGGGGTVYRCFQRSLRRDAVVKVLREPKRGNEGAEERAAVTES